MGSQSNNHTYALAFERNGREWIEDQDEIPITTTDTYLGWTSLLVPVQSSSLVVVIFKVEVIQVFSDPAPHMPK